MSDPHYSTPTRPYENDGRIADGTATPVFYGISVSDSPACVNVGTPLVFTDKAEVLKEIKKIPGARFKAFYSQEEASTFSTCANVSTVPTSADKAQNVEKPLAFKAPTRQEIQRFRKAIEAGDAKAFSSAVWSNPRYLIAGCDTPTILHEGFRYTALHVASKFNKASICKLLLSAIQDLKFLQLLFEDDDLDVQERRIAFLTDLYLNLPDKGLAETPLHFACKFGCAEAVQVLLSHPACDRNRINNYDQTAREIICERCTKPSSALRRQINNLFEDRYFVPVLRSEGNSLTPSLGKPFSPETVSLSDANVASPTKSSLKIRAIAGPMSPEMATQFYKEWKGPATPVSRSNCKTDSMVRRTDSVKGLERIGRDLARKHDVHWNEYWTFLDSWCNFETPSGMTKLERHFQKVNEQIVQDTLNQVASSLEQSVVRDETTPETSKCQSPATPQDNQVELTPVTKLCKQLESFHINSPKKVSSHLCDPIVVPVSQQQNNIKDRCSIDSTRRTLNFDSPITVKCRTEENRPLVKENIDNGATSSYKHENNDQNSDFYTPPSSLSNSESPNSLHTPEEMEPFFIMGLQPSKVDLDVFNALENVRVDPCSYPLVFLWKDDLSHNTYRFTGAVTPRIPVPPVRTKPSTA